MPVTEQAREIGISWERMLEPRPRVTLEIFTPSGQEQIFYLGPHAPRLTPKEIDLLHKVWLELSDNLPNEEIHHHDIVHFALDEVEREIADGQGGDVLNRLRDHLHEIQNRRSFGETLFVLELVQTNLAAVLVGVAFETVRSQEGEHRLLKRRPVACGLGRRRLPRAT